METGGTRSHVGSDIGAIKSFDRPRGRDKPVNDGSLVN